MNYKIQDITLNNIADAINEKIGESEPMTVAQIIQYLQDRFDSKGTYSMDIGGYQYYFEKTNSVPNPDSEKYDGVYRSNNYHIASTSAKIKITFTGYSNFIVYIRSYGEGGYDYIIASDLDVSSCPGSSDSDGVKAHTNGNPQSGTSINDYTKVEYPNDGQEHFFYIVYRKDSSTDKNDDRGYFLIEK